LTASIPLEINSLNVLEGLYTNYLGQTEYGTRPADYIKSEIERLQNEIKDYQLTIDEANQRLVNFIALSGVQYQIEYYKRTIQDVEREIDSYNKEIATRTVNVEYYEKAIAALLAIE
ncbi:MAG: hypothetical protein LBT50_07405, partial [Prevotellaceae bacterium]|nr:hypothetical protein [Prevotellaceae bacterium]